MNIVMMILVAVFALIVVFLTFRLIDLFIDYDFGRSKDFSYNSYIRFVEYIPKTIKICKISYKDYKKLSNIFPGCFVINSRHGVRYILFDKYLSESKTTYLLLFNRRDYHKLIADCERLEKEKKNKKKKEYDRQTIVNTLEMLNCMRKMAEREADKANEECVDALHNIKNTVKGFSAAR